jgi:hypothetical protein
MDHELVLRLTDPAHLFNAPPIDPLSPSEAEVLGVSGADHLINLLSTPATRERKKTLVLELPAPAATSAESITAALHRLAAVRIERDRRELSNTYRYGWKVLCVSFVLLAVCLTMSYLFGSDLTAGMRPLLRKLFEYGFEIMGWVIMWHPIDVLVFNPLAIRHRIRPLIALTKLNVIIRAGI